MQNFIDSLSSNDATPTAMSSVALVTGAAHGIGRETALELARDGHDVVIVDVDTEAIETLAREIEQLGRRSLPLTVDCRDADAIAQAYAKAEHFGQIDVLFNNVGQSAREKASEFWCSDPTVWRQVVDISLMATLHWSRHVVPGMRERCHGRVINMSSDAALCGDARLADYAAAKMGVIGFTRSLARELAPFGVTVNVVCPGAIATRAHDKLAPEALRRVKESTPTGTVGEPEDVAWTVAFLASKKGRFITGQSILIDGARWMV